MKNVFFILATCPIKAKYKAMRNFLRGDSPKQKQEIKYQMALYFISFAVF